MQEACFWRRSRFFLMDMDKETLQATSLRPFSPKKFLNETGPGPVFMSEGTQVVAGEAILCGAATIDRSKDERTENERSRVESNHDTLEALVRSTRDWSTASPTPCCAATTTPKTRPRKRLCECCATAQNSRRSETTKRGWRASPGALPSPQPAARLHSGEIPLEDPEKPVAEVASSAASADQTVLGAQVGAAVEKMIRGASQETARSPDLVNDRGNVTPRGRRNPGHQ